MTIRPEIPKDEDADSLSIIGWVSFWLYIWDDTHPFSLKSFLAGLPIEKDIEHDPRQMVSGE